MLRQRPHAVLAALCLLLVAAAPPSVRRASDAPGPSTEDAAATDRGATARAIGSLDDARVAVPRGPDAGSLTFFARRMPAETRAALQAAAPRVTLVEGLSREDALARADEANAIDAYYATPEFLRAATNLAWVQSFSAGVDRYLAVPELRDDDSIVLTNMRAVHGPTIADHVFATLLALTRDLDAYLEHQEAGRWDRTGSGVLEPVALEGRTLLVVGLGGIGTEIARRGHGFGMHVIATRRSSRSGPDFVDRVGTADELMEMIPLADVVAIAAPLTEETTGLFDADAFAAMKKGSYLVNIGRGRIVVTDDLVAALRSGHLAGAALDVTDPEPLPEGHPLWAMRNVVITPHVAGRAALTSERRTALLLENMRRFDAGEPLLNVVNRTEGY